MEKDFIFMDDETDGKERIFYRSIFYSYIRNLITDFFNAKLEYNDTHLRFISFLETLEDAGDVYFLMHEMPYHWALGIIQNTAEPNEEIMLDENKKNNELEFCKQFLSTSNINYFLEEFSSSNV
ncbi:hypothetical protein [Flavobacterium sp. N502536]|uniref:hypothetical protein n=1 Tax=Flavobacterium sp. N502536 TaxID=2986837 RepID=UPI0022229EDD|nr:hypothetical protein [Flavobacterium sp. N502536]